MQIELTWVINKNVTSCDGSSSNIRLNDYQKLIRLIPFLKADGRSKMMRNYHWVSKSFGLDL
jgi:hypothetical protein